MSSTTPSNGGDGGDGGGHLISASSSAPRGKEGWWDRRYARRQARWPTEECHGLGDGDDDDDETPITCRGSPMLYTSNGVMTRIKCYLRDRIAAIGAVQSAPETDPSTCCTTPTPTTGKSGDDGMTPMSIVYVCRDRRTEQLQQQQPPQPGGGQRRRSVGRCGALSAGGGDTEGLREVDCTVAVATAILAGIQIAVAHVAGWLTCDVACWLQLGLVPMCVTSLLASCWGTGRALGIMLGAALVVMASAALGEAIADGYWTTGGAVAAAMAVFYVAVGHYVFVRCSLALSRMRGGGGGGCSGPKCGIDDSLATMWALMHSAAIFVVVATVLQRGSWFAISIALSVPLPALEMIDWTGAVVRTPRRGCVAGCGAFETVRDCVAGVSALGQVVFGVVVYAIQHGLDSDSGLGPIITIRAYAAILASATLCLPYAARPLYPWMFRRLVARKLKKLEEKQQRCVEDGDVDGRRVVK